MYTGAVSGTALMHVLMHIDRNSDQYMIVIAMALGEVVECGDG